MSALAQRSWITVDGATIRLDDVAALTRYADG
jgi:hypothetical protein